MVSPLRNSFIVWTVKITAWAVAASCCISDILSMGRGDFAPVAQKFSEQPVRNSNFRNMSRGPQHMPNMVKIGLGVWAGPIPICHLVNDTLFLFFSRRPDETAWLIATLNGMRSCSCSLMSTILLMFFSLWFQTAHHHPMISGRALMTNFCWTKPHTSMNVIFSFVCSTKTVTDYSLYS